MSKSLIKIFGGALLILLGMQNCAKASVEADEWSVLRIISDFVNIGDTSFASSPNGIYRSIDLGITWQFTDFYRGLYFGPSLFNRNGILFAGYFVGGDATGVIKSTDRGATWSAISGFTSTNTIVRQLRTKQKLHFCIAL